MLIVLHQNNQNSLKITFHRKSNNWFLINSLFFSHNNLTNTRLPLLFSLLSRLMNRRTPLQISHRLQTMIPTTESRTYYPRHIKSYRTSIPDQTMAIARSSLLLLRCTLSRRSMMGIQLRVLATNSTFLWTSVTELRSLSRFFRQYF